MAVVRDSEGRGLLSGVRVLDLSIWRPGPYATQLLVEMGADVVKVEPPGGDPMRVFPTLFAVLNAGKRSAAVDLKDDPSGKTAVLERGGGGRRRGRGLPARCGARLGRRRRGVRRVNPAVVYCSISGYGQDGPLAEHPGHDINYQAWAATLEPRTTDDEPVVPRPPIADLAGGAYAALAVCAALVQRSRTGEGESIDVSMTDVLASWTGAVPPLTLPDGQAVGGQVRRVRDVPTADGGWVALGVISEDHFWSGLTRTLGLDDAAALTFPERLALGRRAHRAHRQGDRRAGPGRSRSPTLAAAGVPASPSCRNPRWCAPRCSVHAAPSPTGRTASRSCSTRCSTGITRRARPMRSRRSSRAPSTSRRGRRGSRPRSILLRRSRRELVVGGDEPSCWRNWKRSAMPQLSARRPSATRQRKNARIVPFLCVAPPRR